MRAKRNVESMRSMKSGREVVRPCRMAPGEASPDDLRRRLAALSQGVSKLLAAIESTPRERASA